MGGGRTCVVDAAAAPRTARLLLDSPRRPLPACYLLRGSRLYDVGSSPSDVAHARRADADSTVDALPLAFAARESAKAAVAALGRVRLACAAPRVARFLCHASDGDVAFWIGAPGPVPLYRDRFPTVVDGKRTTVALVSRLRRWRPP